MSDPHANIIKQLSFLDRFLFIWLILAMVIGVLLGNFTDMAQKLDTARFDTVSVPIAIGLIIMMIPPLCKVQWENMHRLLSKPKVLQHIGFSLFLNWIIGPVLMFALAEATLPDLQDYRIGVIMVGLARCIAMVLVWNQIAGGDTDLCAIIVIINSALQIVLYPPYALLFINVFDHADQTLIITYSQVARAVGIYLGIPLAIGFIIRFTFLFTTGKEYYEKKVLSIISPFSLIGLIYTIIILFGYQAKAIIHNLGPVFRVFVPLILYFAIMWVFAFVSIRLLEQKLNRENQNGPEYKYVVPQTMTAASNNFELSIAVAAGVYGVTSKQALAATIGPLVEVPVLVILSYVALYLQKKLRWSDTEINEIDENQTQIDKAPTQNSTIGKVPSQES